VSGTSTLAKFDELYSLKRSILMDNLILQTITEIMGKGSKLKDDPKSPAFLARNVYPSLSSFTFFPLTKLREGEQGK
jgi:hypothetical protein